MNRFLLFTMSALLVGVVRADTVTIAADEWYPFNGDPKSSKPGFMIEIAQQALAQAGHTVDYRIMPWERAVDAARKGQINCVVGAYVEDAPDLVYPEEPQGMDDAAFYMQTGKSWDYSVANLAGKTLAVIGGYNYDGGEFDAYVEANKSSNAVHVAKGNDALEKNIKMLLAGRVDIVVESPVVMEAKLEELKLAGKIIEADRMNNPSEVFVACSPKHPKSQDYATALTEGTRQMRASGELAKILAKYGLKDWK